MCDSGRDETPVTVYRLEAEGGSGTLISKTFDLIEMELDSAEVGQKFTIEVAQMPKWEYEDLDEF